MLHDGEECRISGKSLASSQPDPERQVLRVVAGMLREIVDRGLMPR
jgi:hypothetical protein